MILLREKNYTQGYWFRGHKTYDFKKGKRSAKTEGTGFWFTRNPVLAASYATITSMEGFVTEGAFNNLISHTIQCGGRRWSSIKVKDGYSTTDHVVKTLFNNNPSLEAIEFVNVIDGSPGVGNLRKIFPNAISQGLKPSTTFCVRETAINKFIHVNTESVGEFILQFL